MSFRDDDEGRHRGRGIGRRRFLAGASGAVVAGLAGAWPGSAAVASAQSSTLPVHPVLNPRPAPARVPLRHEDHRVVIVGSGFGGGVSALRLAQAGVRSVVLERGARWTTGGAARPFPTPQEPDKRILWHRSAPQLFGRPLAVEPYTGLIETVVGENMTALCPTGLGGGSLVYQGMTLQPSEEVFSRWFPGGIDWDEMDRVHYPAVARMLRVREAPDRLVDSEPYRVARVFADRVRAAGLPLRKIPMPIDWEIALAELRGEIPPELTNGDGVLGVNNGGKHSVDATYIRQAEATGLVDVRTCHEVRGVERTPDGRWRLHVQHTDTSGRVLEDVMMTSDALIMAAGSINTTRMLVRAQALGTVPDLPETLGEGYGTNADRIYAWSELGVPFGARQGGPVVYGSTSWADPETAHTVIQASIPNFGGLDPHSAMLVGFGVSEGRGRIRYDGRTDQGELWWPRDGDGRIQWGHIDRTVRAIAGPRAHLTDTNALHNTTWHSLGGANMDVTCDLEGRVRGQRGLYVIDGALMPGTTAACNPSMTIASIAERALSRIVRQDVGAVF